MTQPILTAAEIAALPGTAKTHFRNPGARRINRALGDATGLTGIGVHLIEIAPGDATSEHHRHHHEDECVYVLAGQGTVWLGEVAHPIGPGDFIAHPKGGPAHHIVNTGTEVLRCLVIGERLAHDVCDYPRQNKRLLRNAGLPWMLVDLDQIELLGGAVGKK